MYKDACLIEAALATDRTVASLDEHVSEHYFARLRIKLASYGQLSGSILSGKRRRRFSG